MINRDLYYNYNQTLIVFFIILDAEVYYNAHFGMGPGPILMSNIRCASPQSSLLVCTYSFDYNRYCTHHNDAGVKCTCKLKNKIG